MIDFPCISTCQKPSRAKAGQGATDEKPECTWKYMRISQFRATESCRAQQVYGRSRLAGGQFSSFIPSESPRVASTSLISLSDLRPRLGVFKSSVSVR